MSKSSQPAPQFASEKDCGRVTARRELKGIAKIEFSDGTMCESEIHWYEAQGIGAKEYKIKRILG
jgi:hypothetical protein